MNVPLFYEIKELAQIISGDWIQKNHESNRPAYLSLDSRKILYPKESLFWILPSSHQDAHQFIAPLYEKGVRNFVIEHKNFPFEEFPKANFIRCGNGLHALQKLAQFHRKQFSLNTIGITGSNGKTIVKEWLYHLLEKDFNIVRSPRSFNSQIGVPLSVLLIQPENNLGIFEAGISRPDEMKKLSKIINPQIGILTNIGKAHDEGFINRQQKIQEKLQLFQHASWLIYNGDEAQINKEVKKIQSLHPQLKSFSWGYAEKNSLRILSIKFQKEDSIIRVKCNNKIYKIQIPFRDSASIENSINCLSVLFLLDKCDEKILNRFSTLFPIAMRLELKTGMNRNTIINDSYSNDLHSLNVAFHFLNQQKQHATRTVILSDILQSGLNAKKLYRQVADLCLENKIDKLFGVGPDISAHQELFHDIPFTQFFSSTSAFLKSEVYAHLKDEAILLKGARTFAFEKICHVLEQKVHQTVLSIHLNHLVQNLKTYRQQLHPKTKIMVMVKAFSYGSGSYEIASVLAQHKVDYLAVAYADEGVELRKAGITMPIMVMNVDESVFDTLINHQLEPEIFSFDLLHSFSKFLNRNNVNAYPIHLKIDTGMHRLGFMENEIAALGQSLKSLSSLKVKSVFSHLAASDEKKQNAFTLKQYRQFKKICEQLNKQIGYSFIRHIANTSAITNLPELQMDMVRLGIGLYGIDANPEMQKKLVNVSTLTTTISQIKEIKAGETVGYGRKGKIGRPSKIATVRIGYADGYSRALSNGVGKMLVKNKLAPVIGNICMDMTMIDITGIKDVREGDEVIVFGAGLPVQQLAKWSHTIPYEIMTSISQRVKRVYFDE